MSSMPRRCRPGEVFQACPTERRPQGRPGPAGRIISLSRLGNAVRSLQESWRRWVRKREREREGGLCWICCPSMIWTQISSKNEWMEEWILYSFVWFFRNLGPDVFMCPRIHTLDKYKGFWRAMWSCSVISILKRVKRKGNRKQKKSSELCLSAAFSEVSVLV